MALKIQSAPPLRSSPLFFYPVFFIDDLLKNFEGIEPPGIQWVHLDRECSDAQNARHGGIARHIDAPTLADFVEEVRLQSVPALRSKAPR